MHRFKKSTIKDVAARVGVSTTTVSLFVSGRDGVCSAETAKRIQEAIRELHYTPSSLTKGLRQKATRTFGICTYGPLQALLPSGHWFVETLWRGVAREADAQRYALLYYPEDVRSGESCDAFLDGRVDALLADARLGRARAETVTAAGLPLVMLTRSTSLVDGCGTAYADEAQAVHLAMAHLWGLGHRRIAHLVGPVIPMETGFTDDVAPARLDAYRAWLTERTAYDPALESGPNSWERPHTAAAMAHWRRMADPPTAILAANDAMAADALHAARALGWRVPTEVSLAGIDNSPLAAVCDPPLTSVAIPVEEVGREGVRSALRMMEGRPLAECRVSVPVIGMSVRATTAPPAR